VQQKTQFATSIFRPGVINALDFRNRFAERPFLCRELVEPENILVSCCCHSLFWWYKSVCHFYWSVPLHFIMMDWVL